MKDDWDTFQKETAVWQDETFPHATLHSKLEHVRKETKEIEDNPSDLYEWADVMLIFLHALSGQGIKVSELLCACREKQEICRNREWGEPNPVHGYTEHKR